MLKKAVGILTLLCFIISLVSCYSQYLLKNEEWFGSGKVMRIITNDGKLVELKTIKGVEEKLQKEKVKGHEWDPVSKTWSDREVSLSEIRYLWVEQIEAGRTILLIIGISSLALVIGSLIALSQMDWGCLLCGIDFLWI